MRLLNPQKHNEQELHSEYGNKNEKNVS